MSKVEVVSSLNLLSQASEMLRWASRNSTSKYNPKVYLGSIIQTIANYWLTDDIVAPTTWPSSYQSATQKQVFISLYNF